jgi:hypothetical protein
MECGRIGLHFDRERGYVVWLERFDCVRQRNCDAIMEAANVHVLAMQEMKAYGVCESAAVASAVQRDGSQRGRCDGPRLIIVVSMVEQRSEGFLERRRMSGGIRALKSCVSERGSRGAA